MGKRTKSILIQLDRMPGIVQSKMIDNNGDTLQWHIMAGKVLWVATSLQISWIQIATQF